MDKEKLRNLKGLIAVGEGLLLGLKEKKELFEAECVSVKALIQANAEEVEALKKELELEAIKEFEDTGKKKLEGGLGIRETTKLLYDTKAVEVWCKSKEMFLEVDFKAFEKVAVNVAPDLVTESKEVKVTFPKVIEIAD